MIRPSRDVLVLAGCSLLAAVGLWCPAFFSLQATGFGDWQFFHHMWEAGYVAVTRYGEWPLWDPYHCGGITIFGNPQSQHLSPFYWIAFLVGPTLGSKIFLVLHAWAGFAGMYLLARKTGLALPGALLATLAWAASGFFASHGSGGHSAFLPFYLAPWLLLAWRAAAHDVRYAAAVAALLTLVLLEGGVYPFPYFVVLLAFDAVLRLCLRDEPRGILRAGLIAAPLTGLLGAVRALPIIDELRRNPRTMESLDGVSLAEVLEMLTARRHGWRYLPHPFVWPEYVTYVGWGILGLGLLGLLGCLRPRPRHVPRRIAVGLFVFLALMMGDHGTWSLWSLLHRLPIYDSLRVPSRFAVFFTLYLGLCAGAALDFLVARLSAATSGKVASLGAYAVTAVIAADLFIVHLPTLDRWTDPPIQRDHVSDRYYLSTLDYGRYYASFPAMNLGTRSCYEAMSFTPARGLWSGDRPQARVTRGDGEVSSFVRTTTHVLLQADLRSPARVLVNQNFAPGWQSNHGTVVADAGRLAIDLPAGHYVLDVVYRPPTLLLGAVLSILGLVLALLLVRFAPRRSEAHG